MAMLPFKELRLAAVKFYWSGGNRVLIRMKVCNSSLAGGNLTPGADGRNVWRKSAQISPRMLIGPREFARMTAAYR